MRHPISDEQIEIIKATYAETGNLRASARAAKCAVASAKKYAGSRDEFEHLRTEKRIDIIAKIAQAQVALIDSMLDPDALRKASLQEKSVAFGIVTDKGLLLTGQPTNRTHSSTDDPAMRLTPDEMETAAKIRDKIAAEVGV